MTALRRRRLEWTRENDHVWGPFLYARDTRWKPTAIIIDSGNEDYPGAALRISGFGHTVKVALPAVLVPPQRRKVYPDSWDAETIKRLGRNWYWDVTEREFGFTLSDGHLSFKFGRQTGDSRTEKHKGFFLPWTQWRFIRTSHYTPTGEHIRTFPAAKRGQGLNAFNDEYAFEQTLPTVDFEFDDYDGERIVVKTRIEEREWRFGTKWCSWLSVFRKPKISRTLDLRFMSETGPRKGSWKGGTIGHSCDIAPGETPESAFRKYCEKRNMKFVGQVA